MNTSYSGNTKPYILALYSGEDKARVMPVLEELDKRGWAMCGQDGRASVGKAKRALTVLVFLSKAFAEDQEAQGIFFAADAAGVSVIPVHLDDHPQPEVLQQALFAKHSLMADRYSSVSELVDRICASEALKSPSVTPAQKKARRKIMYVLIAAVVLVVAAGVYWLLQNKQEPPQPTEPETTQEETAPQEETTTAVDPSVWEQFGITDPQLVKDLVIIGDHFEYYTDADLKEFEEYPDCRYLSQRSFEDEGIAWRWKEDGSEIAMTSVDLGVLEYLPNLNQLNMAMVEPENIPDLSGLENLSEVRLLDCAMDDVSWLAGTKVRELEVLGTGIRDYSPLTECLSLKSVQIDLAGQEQADFSAFGPRALEDFVLENGDGLNNLDLGSLVVCNSLQNVRFSSVPVPNLSCLESADKLQELVLEDMGWMEDISSLEKLISLRRLEIRNCPRVADYTPIGVCSSLQQVYLEGDRGALTDASFLGNLPMLTDISLNGFNLRNLDFLGQLPKTVPISLGFSGEIEDYSGLAEIEEYDRLFICPRGGDSERGGEFSAVLPYIQDAVVESLHLESCAGVDLSALPDVKSSLDISRGDLADLKGIQDSGYRRISLYALPYLTSLEGIDSIQYMDYGYVELDIRSCPRLTDFSALEGKHLGTLRLAHMYTLPDLGSFQTDTLRLEQIYGLTDLSCLSDIDEPSRFNLELVGLDEVTDLTPLYDLYGNSLTVMPEVKEQAALLVENGNFQEYHIEYPAEDWEKEDDFHVVLASLEELGTLPEALLRRVERLAIVGDQVFDPEQINIWKEWEEGSDTPILMLHDRETDETFPIEMGTMKNLKALEPLTGLKELMVFAQPLTSLDGLQGMLELEFLDITFCPDLSDASAAYTLQRLDHLGLEQSRVKSIVGIQNLRNLRNLNICGTDVDDLSPLSDCDFSYAYEQGGISLFLDRLPCEDFSPLSGLKEIERLSLNEIPSDLWLEDLSDMHIRALEAVNGFDKKEDLEKLVEEHPELEELLLSWSDNLKDLTPLLSLEHLQHVRVSADMEEAIESLGEDYGFELEIEG